MVLRSSDVFVFSCSCEYVIIIHMQPELGGQPVVKKSSHHVLKYALLFLLSVVVIFTFFVILGVSGSSAEGGVFGDADRPTIGPDTAAVKIVEYSDFQCPFCQRAIEPLRQALAPYGDRVQLEFRHYPLYSIHSRAVAAGVASECAHDQEKFWEFHDVLFENQQLMTDKDFLKHARKAGLDVGVFWDCYASQKHLSRINRDFQAGSEPGVRSTPTFFVNGKRVEGALSVTQWSAIMKQVAN